MATMGRKYTKLAKEMADWGQNFYRQLTSENLVPVRMQ